MTRGLNNFYWLLSVLNMVLDRDLPVQVEQIVTSLRGCGLRTGITRKVVEGLQQ